MASVTITTRTVKSGRRFIVRYRAGGRAFQQHHAGSFHTRKEAEMRRAVVAGELAHGRDPQLILHTITATGPTLFPAVAAEYRKSRVDVATETGKSIDSHIKILSTVFGRTPITAITKAQIQAWVAEADQKPSTIRKYTRTLKLILDFAEITPNPGAGIRYPRQEHEEIRPPSKREVAAILDHCSPRWRDAVEFLEATGLRVGELCRLGWGDVDFAEGRVRVADGKTRAARRWVPLPAGIVERLTETPMDDRVGQVFAGANEDKIASAMTYACKLAGIAHYHPHDLRHRYISLLVKQGIPITTISAQVGHTSKVLTLDTYSHVLIDE